MKFAPNYFPRPGSTYSPNPGIFWAMDKNQLKEFYEWFMSSLPYCLEELMQLVVGTPGFEDWNADDSPDSLNGLGDWFAMQVETRELSQDELQAIKATLISPIEIQTWTLTDETKSLALYVGMYYGEVAIKNNPLLKWEQSVQMAGKKKMVDYGQPVVAGGNFVPTNPVRVAHVFANGIASGGQTGRRLREVYESRAKLVMAVSKN
ncbi:hypothetical protein ACO0LM_15860 [Undibacterium sp. Di26W]|uniref:hypothetical protein n=1 Tax=Undibacterium sp. Di26W TaxID=3413035 RepID=UPI003BF155A5